MERRSTRCYIDEYTTSSGELGARLREKHSGRKVDLGISDASEKARFLDFLSAIKRSQNDIPGVFLKDSDDDCVVVSGEVDFDAPDEIRYVYNASLSYLVQ